MRRIDQTTEKILDESNLLKNKTALWFGDFFELINENIDFFSRHVLSTPEVSTVTSESSCMHPTNILQHIQLFYHIPKQLHQEYYSSPSPLSSLSPSLTSHFVVGEVISPYFSPLSIIFSITLSTFLILTNDAYNLSSAHLVHSHDRLHISLHILPPLTFGINSNRASKELSVLSLVFLTWPTKLKYFIIISLTTSYPICFNDNLDDVVALWKYFL